MKIEQDTISCFSCPARALSTFAQLSEDECKLVDQLRQFQVFQAGEVLRCKVEGNTPEENVFYCIRSGQVKVTAQVHGSKHRVMSLGGPGNLVGYGCWEQGLDPHATAVVEPTQVCAFRRTAFLPLQRQFMSIAEGIIRTFIHMVNERDRRISALEIYTVRNRIAALLVDLNQRFGDRVDDGFRLHLSVDRRTLAELSGTCSETFSRILTELEQDNLIRRDQREIIILDHERLKRVAGS